MAKEFVKIELEKGDEYYKLHHDKLVDNVAFYYDINIKEFLYSLNYSLEYCESPIEQLLAMALENYRIINFQLFNPKIELLGYQKNEWVKANNQSYRVDFLFDFLFRFENLLVSYNLIVECDGFKYHQGNKEQIDKDYKRQNDLLANGYDIMRFTGAMINKSPDRCAMDIIKHVVVKFETMEKGIK